MKPAVVTVEPSLVKAKRLIDQLKHKLDDERHRRLLTAFTALAEGDQAIGLLAYYLWRKQNRRQSED